MPEYKIWIFFSLTGGGHRSAAEAIQAALVELGASKQLGDRLQLHMDAIAERSHPVNRFFVDLYNFLLRHKQSWMKYYYNFLTAIKPNDSELGYRLIKPLLRELVTKEAPTVIVSVHPMLNHYLARNRRELGLTKTVRLIEVVTDPNQQLWKAWACTDVDLIIAPNDIARDQLVEWGVQPERIRILGMPIHSKFLRPARSSKSEFMKAAGLDPNLLTVCLNAGWAGGGNMRQIYNHLSAVKRPFQVLFLCGHNDVLFEQIKKDLQTTGVKTAVLPYHDSMVDVMTHVDLMVTKAGGLTTFEAIAKRLPIAFDVITEPMPQESGTVDMLLKQGLCYAIKQPSDIVGVVEALQISENRQSLPLPVAHSLDRTNAAYEIAKIVLAACEPGFDLVCDTVPVQPLETAYGSTWEGGPQLGLEGT
jgi:UDP-N-acetylglucosamine:LPS N-acetylglucosamine transferase